MRTQIKYCCCCKTEQNRTALNEKERNETKGIKWNGTELNNKEKKVTEPINENETGKNRSGLYDKEQKVNEPTAVKRN